jgi:uncharacterized membrane protein YbhN (UPF0104 family)
MTEAAPLEPAEPSGSVWRARIRWLVLVSGLIGLAIITRQALSEGESPVPSPAASAAALVLYGGAGIAAARAWSVLLGPAVDPIEVRGAMYASQLSKYVPGGGVLQAAGQVVLSTSDRLTVRRSALSWAASMVLTVVAGVVLLSGLAVLGAFEGGPRAIAVLGFAALLAVDRRRLAWVLTKARRLTSRIPEPDLLPDQRALYVALVWTAGSLLLSAASYATILADLDSGVSAVDVLPAFVAGWLAGFLLVPLPAGLGAREAVLVALIPGSTTGLVLGASLSQRAIAFVAELALFAGNRFTQRRRRIGGD